MCVAFQTSPKVSFGACQDVLVERPRVLLPFSPDGPKSEAPSVDSIFEHSIVPSTIHQHPNILNPGKQNKEKSIFRQNVVSISRFSNIACLSVTQGR